MRSCDFLDRPAEPARETQMPRKGRSNEEIVHALRQVESGEKVTEVCRRIGVTNLLSLEETVRGLGPAGNPRVAIPATRKHEVEATGRGPDARSSRPSGDRAKKTLKPRARCTLADWAQTTYRLSQRRAARLIPVRIQTLRYRLTRDRQDALRPRLRELAAVRVRFGYRRLTVLLKREGWRVNAKRIYRLYGLEGLTVRTKPRRKLASRARAPLPAPTRPNQRWSMDFVSTRLVDGRWFRTLTVLDLFTRESVALVADRSLTGIKVASALTQVLRERPAPQAITVDNGGEFVSRAMDAWAYAHDVRLDFIRPGKPVENAFIESFNGRLRDECLSSHVFSSVTELRSSCRRGATTIIASVRTVPWPIGRPRKPPQCGSTHVRHVSRLKVEKHERKLRSPIAS